MMLKINAPFQILSNSFGLHMSINMVKSVMAYATRTNDVPSLDFVPPIDEICLTENKVCTDEAIRGSHGKDSW